MTRSLETAALVGNDDAGDPIFECLCDCATTTRITLVSAAPATTEFAFTCQGCSTSHWLTLKVYDLATGELL